MKNLQKFLRDGISLEEVEQRNQAVSLLRDIFSQEGQEMNKDIDNSTSSRYNISNGQRNIFLIPKSVKII